MEEKTYTIMVQGHNWRGEDHERKWTLRCTEAELENVAKVWLWEYNSKYRYVCCIANEGNYIDNNHFTHLFQDCM